MANRRSYVATAELGGRIYAAGGMVGDSGRRLDRMQRFEPRRGVWETRRRLPEPVRAAEGAALDGLFYVVGGTTDDGGGRQVYAYEPARDEWEVRAPLPEPRSNHAVVALDGKLWVIGGWHDGREHAEVFVYEPRRDRWSRGPSLPRPTHALGAVAFRGRLWAIGGRRGGQRQLREVWILDPGAGWRPGPSLPRPMELLGADVAGDEIHTVWERTYQIRDASEGRWRQDVPPQVHRHALALFALGGRLYAVGGCTTRLRDSAVVETRAL
jgi:Kelch motif